MRERTIINIDENKYNINRPQTHATTSKALQMGMARGSKNKTQHSQNTITKQNIINSVKRPHTTLDNSWP